MLEAARTPMTMYSLVGVIVVIILLVVLLRVLGLW